MSPRKNIKKQTENRMPTQGLEPPTAGSTRKKQKQKSKSKTNDGA
jgi:hypothetical protein